MKLALVHDWLIHLAGAEKALESLVELYQAPIFTLLKDHKKLKGTFFEKQTIHSTFIERLPFAKRFYNHYLPLFPMAIEQHDLGEFDVIVSSSHCVAKGVLTHPHQLHICYCYTPMRYLWDFYHTYLDRHGLKKGIKGAVAKYFLHKLRMWDFQSSARVDHFVAISTFVKKRIEKVYRRESIVIHPPCAQFDLCEKKEDFYLTASRLVPYKRIDLLVEAFNKLPKKKLVVIGNGPELKKLKGMAKKNIEFLGHVSRDGLNQLYGRAKAFLFASFEDFGIAPVEAMSAGTPVIAFGKGGVLDTVIENKTGLFFNEQTVQSIIDAIGVFETKTFYPKTIAKHAQLFDKKHFKKKFNDFLTQKRKEQLV
jgi:glycosyltransferase involved in cell wall biosynthesis